METIYRANDGKEFLDEDECRDYENELRIKNGAMPKMWSSDFDTIITDFNDFDHVYFINIENDSQIETFVAMAEYYGLDYYGIDLKKAGLYYWEVNEDRWINVSDRLNELRKEVIELEEIKTKMLG